MNHDLSSSGQLLSEGLAAWVCDRPFPQQSTNQAASSGELHGMASGLNTCLPLHTAVGHGYGLCSTSPIHRIENHLFISVIGQPRWSDSSLTELASKQGHSAAAATAYLKYDEACLQKLRGDFLLLAIDFQQQKVLMATDRMGRHQGYYARSADNLVVGSQAKAVLGHPDIKKEISEQGIYNYMYFHMVPSPSSIYRNLHKLHAASQLSLQRKDLKIQRYWQPNFQDHNPQSLESLSQRLKDLLSLSVKHCLNESDTVGSFLSGGLDSSTVTGMLAKQHMGKAYSIGFSAEGYDEMEFARISANHFNIPLEEYYVTPDDVVKALPAIATNYDEPFGNSSALPAYFCARMAKEDGISLLLAGDGGDELFAGNERYAKQCVFEAYQQLPPALRNQVLEPLVKKLPSDWALIRKSQSYIDQANISLPERLQTYNFLHRHAPTDIFADGLIEQVSTQMPIEIQQEIYAVPHEADKVNRMMFLDWQLTLADNDLRKVSGVCALAGVHVQYPMLDDDLIEFSCAVPSSLKLNNPMLKGQQGLRYFYKKALTGWLPNETIQKQKQGFGLPFGVWMRTHKPLQELAYDTLTDLKQRHYFSDKFIDHAIDMHKNGHASYYGELIWVMSVLELWSKHHSPQLRIAA